MAMEVMFYTLDEISELVHVTPRTLYTYIKDGKLAAVKIGRRWRVTEANLKAFLAKGTKG